MEIGKYYLRAIYNTLRSRRLRVVTIQIAQFFNIPIYRLGLDTNNICNLKCVICYLSVYKAQKPDIMPIDLFESIANQIFPRVKILDLSCGFEPFMTKNFLEYLRIARRYCKGKIGICTNALLMNEKDIQAVVSEELLDEINISCDGFKEATYNSVRKNGDFFKLLHVLETLRNEKQTNNTGRPIIRLNYTMLRRNIEDLEGAYDFVKTYDIDILQLRHAKLTREFSELFSESLFFHQDLSDAIISKVRQQFDNDKKVQLIHPPLFSDKSSSVVDKSACAYPWFNFIIASNGDLRLCNIGVIGNLKESSFLDMKSSNSVKSVYRRLLDGDYEDLCKSCYTVSDMEDIRSKSTFIRDDIMVDRAQSGELVSKE